jgi:hypothetical protein
MPWKNVPAYDTTNLSFGQGVLYLGPAGSTPTTDVGAIRGDAKLTITRNILEVMQGAPQRLIKQYVTKEDVTFTFTGMEWNFTNLYRALGGGDLTTGSNEDTLEGGGDMNMTDVALRAVHSMPSGHTIEIYFWKAQGSGEINVTFGDELQEFPYTFRAMHAATDWAGNALADTKSLYKLRRIKA